MKTSPTAIHVHRSKSLLQAELAIAYVLRGGVALSGTLIFIGLLAKFGQGNSDLDHTHQLLSGLMSSGMANELAAVRSVSEFVRSIGHLTPESVITLGLVVLVALPVVRVAMTVVLFVIERDYVYLAITVFVLAVLVSGIVFGRAL